MLAGIFPDAHLVVEEGVRLALDDFQHGGGFFFEGKDFGVPDVCAGPDFSGCALADGEGPSGLVEIPEILDGGIFCDEKREADAQIGIRESDGLAALGGVGHGGNDAIDFACFERGDESGERDVFDADRASEVFAESPGEVHAHAGGISGSVNCLKRRVGQFHADDEFVRGFSGRASAGKGGEGEQAEKAGCHPGICGMFARFGE